MTQQSNSIRFLSFLGAILGATSALAGGFEKATTWSGRYTGVGSAAVGHVTGSESLYFNPAGLAGSSTNGDVSLNFSPTWGAYEGPFITGVGGAPEQLETGRILSPVFGGVVSYKVIPKLGIGAGYFVSGGAAPDYKGIDFTNLGNTAFEPNLKTKLSISEASLGAAYEIVNGLRLGVAWRYSFVNATLCQPNIPSGQSPGTQLLEICLNNLKDQNAKGMRIGLQYEAKSWGLGLNVRTPIKFTAEGRAAVSGSIGNQPEVSLLAAGDGQIASISSEFPLQIEFGGFIEASNYFNLYYSYGFSKYSNNKSLTQTIASSSSSTTLNWKDQHHVRLGAEYDTGSVPVRLGYVLITAVTNPQYATPTSSSPGLGHIMSLGTGYEFNKSFSIDLAGEISFASGAGKSPATLGNYKTSSFALHSGLNFKF